VFPSVGLAAIATLLVLLFVVLVAWKFPKSSVWFVLIGLVPLTGAGILGMAVISPRGFDDPQALLSGGNRLEDFMLLLLISSAAFAFTAIPALLVMLQIRERRTWYAAARYALLRELMLVVTSLNKGDVKFSQPNCKRDIIAHLERAAIYLSLGIPKSAALPTPAGRAALQ
jgi:hypothetical protein